ncbi:MAG: sulfatase-like hydrolase/transferase [Synoicihabitans sp.]
MIKKLVSWLSVGFALMGSIGSSVGAADQSKPNIVFIFADDLGFADLGSYGHPYALTPALDKLAAQGTRFTQMYVTGVTCCPSRTGLMTGIHPARYPRYMADFGFGDRTTITALLNQNGYRTGHFGKWHIGPKETEVDGMYGIDEVQVIGGDKKDKRGRDTKLFSAAIDFITENADRPFYLNIWGHATHFPVDTHPDLVDKFATVKVRRSDFSATMQPKFDECEQIGGELDEAMKQYLGDVYSVDLNVARVMNTLDELGLSDNTIVVFSSDHGPAPVILGGKKSHREFSQNMLGYAGIYRGGKHEQLEGGVRVPFIVRWPGRVPAGRVNEGSVMSFMDWMPTLAALVGIETLPPQLDGEDVSDIWMGETRSRSKPQYWRPSSPRAGASMREGDWKLHMKRRNGDAPIELYDLANDPTESRNLAKTETKIAEAMTQKLRAWVEELPTSYEKNK